MAKVRKPGIWAMESDWSARATDVRSVAPVLTALEQAGQAKCIHRSISGEDELIKQLIRFGEKGYDSFTIGYVAMHGGPGKVYVGRKSIDLLGVAQQIPRGRLQRKVIHFGSCSVLTDGAQRQELRKALGARALTGFTEDVDWFESLAFEILLFDALTYYQRLDAAEGYIRREHGEFADKLGFVMERERRSRRAG